MKKSMKRMITSVLLSVMMVIQICNVYAANTAVSVPNQVTSASSTYKQIPVYFNGNEVTEFSTGLRKYNDTAVNANEKFDISGIATFRVRAYAYGTGNNVKLGTYIECLGTDGNWFEMDWRDQEDQVNGTDLAAFIEGNKDVSITITDIQFTMPNQNENDLRVTFSMEASTGGKFSRPTNKNVQFATKSNVNVTRTVTEVTDEKNVWEVELKVEGKAEEIVPTTDVVLVLDRSGSMNERQNKCGKDEHEHIKSCYNKQNTLICNKEVHKHSSACGPTRAQLVQEASKQLVTELVSTKNVNVAIVSFGGNNSSQSLKYEHYNEGTWDPFEKGRGEDNWYSNYTVNTSFTNSSSDLNSGIATALNNPSGGTPMSLGMIKAGLLLKGSDANNKIVILLSDGEPTYKRDGSGKGNRNDAVQNAKIDEDTINAANEVKDKVAGVKIYTIAAGNSIGTDGKTLLSACATNQSYAYKAEDTASALESVMSSIANEINNDIAEGAKLTDVMSENFTLILPSDEMSTNVKTVLYDKMKDIDWNTTGVAISQGSMQTLSNGGVEWNIGKSTAGTPAVMKYRIYMKSGKLGVLYNISSEAKLEYTDADNKAVSLAVPNQSIKASWARVNVASYSYQLKSKVSGSDFTIWMDVPNDYTEGALKIGRKTKVNSSTSEIVNNGDTTIEDKVVLPTSVSKAKMVVMLSEEASESEVSTTLVGSSDTPELVAIVANGKNYNIQDYGDNIILTTVITDIGYYYAKPSLEATIDDNNNFIQPQGITNISAEIDFDTKSKDVSYAVDISNLVNEKFNGEQLMNYKLDKATVQIIDVNSSATLTRDTDYTIQSIVGNEMVILFNAPFIEVGAKYKIAIYVPTTMGDKIVYGGGNENTYLKKYIDVHQTGTIKATIKASPKVGEVTLETNQTVEVYSSVPFSTEDTISLKYLEIAKIN